MRRRSGGRVPRFSRLGRIPLVFVALALLCVAGLAQRDLHGLPDTQSEQRAAIIQWRTGLAVLARRVAFTLPEDLHAAGRGEIAPSPSGN